MPSAKTPSIFATLLYSGKGSGNVVLTNLGPNTVSVRTGINNSGSIYKSVAAGETLTGVPAYLCNVKNAYGNDIAITPPLSRQQADCIAPSDTQSITDKEEVRIDGYLRKHKQTILSRRTEGVSGRKLDARNHFSPSVQCDSDTCVHNAIYHGVRRCFLHTGTERKYFGHTSAERLLALKLLLDGRRVSVGTRRVA